MNVCCCLNQAVISIWLTYIGCLAAEHCKGSAEVCRAEAARENLLLQTSQTRSERVISKVNHVHESFCCMYASNKDDACGTCEARQYGNTYCGWSAENCRECGERF